MMTNGAMRSRPSSSEKVFFQTSSSIIAPSMNPLAQSIAAYICSSSESISKISNNGSKTVFLSVSDCVTEFM